MANVKLSVMLTLTGEGVDEDYISSCIGLFPSRFTKKSARSSKGFVIPYKDIWSYYIDIFDKNLEDNKEYNVLSNTLRLNSENIKVILGEFDMELHIVVFSDGEFEGIVIPGDILKLSKEIGFDIRIFTYYI